MRMRYWCLANRRRRILPRFTLRSILIIMTAACIAAGLGFRERRRVARSIEHLERCGAVVIYAFEKEGTTERWSSRWLRRVLNERYCEDPICIGFVGGTADDSCMVYLRDLHRLEDLTILSVPVTDKGLQNVLKLPALKSLQLHRTHVTDDGVRSLIGLHQLRSVSIVSDRVSLATIEEIRRFLPDFHVAYSSTKEEKEPGLDH